MLVLGANARGRAAEAIAAGPSATWNSADKSANITLSNGDKTATNTVANTYSAVRGTRFISSAKTAFAVKGVSSSSSGNILVGIGNSSAILNSYVGSNSSSIGYAQSGLILDKGNVGSTYASWGISDEIVVAYDPASNTVAFYKNGVLQTSIAALGINISAAPMFSVFANGDVGPLVAPTFLPSGYVAWTS